MNESIACIISSGSKVLLGKRLPSGSMGNRWEFPGGKIEPNETREQAIVREIKEELDMDIEVNEYLAEKTFVYPEKQINLIALSCTKTGGEIKLLEHEAYRWVTNTELDQFEFAPADLFIVDKLKE